MIPLCWCGLVLGHEGGCHYCESHALCSSCASGFLTPELAAMVAESQARALEQDEIEAREMLATPEGADSVECSYCGHHCQSRCIESQDARAENEAIDDARASE